MLDNLVNNIVDDGWAPAGVTCGLPLRLAAQGILYHEVFFSPATDAGADASRWPGAAKPEIGFDFSRRQRCSGVVVMKNAYLGKAHGFIRQKILSGEFKPGYRLKTRELTHMIKVSATPVREALRLLESEGLVEILPRLGASVKTFDVVGFKELSELRCALECLAAELAAINRTEAELAEIESALHEMGRIVEKHGGNLDEASRSALRTADIQFHIAILAAAHNQTLYSEVLRLQVVHRINSPINRGVAQQPTTDSAAWQNSVYNCHQRIFVGIRDRNPEAARLAMKEHIQGIVDRAVLAMAKSLHGSSVARVSTETFGYIE